MMRLSAKGGERSWRVVEGGVAKKEPVPKFSFNSFSASSSLIFSRTLANPNRDTYALGVNRAAERDQKKKPGPSKRPERPLKVAGKFSLA